MEVLFCMAIHLRWCFGDDEVPGDVIPTPNAIPAQTTEKPPVVRNICAFRMDHLIIIQIFPIIISRFLKNGI
jgi:hypothetical protein